MNKPSLAQARYNMIEQQVRPCEVIDPRVLEIIQQTPRDAFVAPALQALAYSDTPLPLGREQVMLTPILEGKILQALEIRPNDKILEIGTGSGYFTALLAQLGGHVYSVDIIPEFTSEAGRRLQSLGIANVTLETGNAAQGWEQHTPYDVIVVTGSLPMLPEALKNSLAPEGRMFVITGDAPIMECHLITRLGPSSFVDQTLMETHVPPLLEAPAPERFVF